MKKISILSLTICAFALFSLVPSEGKAQSQYRGTGSGYNQARPMYTGSNPFYFTRQRKALTFSKDDCEYQIKLCLDEFCYDEFDGYKNCRDNNIGDFNQVVQDCFQGMKSSSIKQNYITACKSYIPTAVTAYLKQMKQFLQYQTTMAECDNAKDRVRAAQSCYGIAMSMGESSFNKALKDSLTTACGADVKGGSATMVEEFFNAGYMGTDGAGWLANFGMLNFTSKKNNWEKVVDSILARYIDMKKAECGEGDYTVGQQGVATSGLSSQGDALRVGAVVGIMEAVGKGQETKATQEKAAFAFTKINWEFKEEDLNLALTNLSNDVPTSSSEIQKIMDELKGVFKKGSYIGVLIQTATKTECKIYTIKNTKPLMYSAITDNKAIEGLKKNNNYIQSFFNNCGGGSK